MIRSGMLAIARMFRRLESLVRRAAELNVFAPSPYVLDTQPSVGPHKIVHVNGNFVVGGNTQLIVDLIERTSNVYSHEVIVPEYPRPLPYQPVNIHEFALDRITDLYEYLAKVRPDLIHVNYWVKNRDRYRPHAIWFGMVFKICEELNIPVIQNLTIPAGPYISSTVVHNVFVSRFVADNFNTAPQTPHSVIYPGADFQHFRNESVSTLPENSIGMVYRLEREKLNADAIEVFIAAAKKKPCLKCHIVGGGYYLDLYKRRVRDERLSKNFEFHGFVSYADLPSYYRKFAIFVAPVHDESFGQVTPFAMAMGQCVAGYDVGALPEILGSRETLAPSGDAGSLANLIIELLEDSARRIQLGRKNQERALLHFSVESMVEAYKVLYARYVPQNVSKYRHEDESNNRATRLSPPATRAKTRGR